MRANTILNNFTSGELSPLLDGRIDLQQYAHGAAELTNWFIMPYGGITRRLGTKYVAEVKDSSQKVRLVPFQFNVEQAYVLEFGDYYIRFYKDNGQIVDGGSAVEISTPYSEDEIDDLQFAQDADVMYIAHKSHYPRKLSRSSHINWSLDETTLEWGPFLPVNKRGSNDFNPSDKSGNINIVMDKDTFQPGHVGAYWYFREGYCRITSVTNAQRASAVVLNNFKNANKDHQWREGAWSDYRGYPACVTISEQRLMFARSDYQPQTIWASQSGDFENFQDGPDDADALIYTIGSEQVNVIRWLSPGKKVIAGTSGGIFIIGAGTTSEPLTPTNVLVYPESTYGAEAMLPEKIGSSAFYMQRGARILRQIAYDFESDSHVAINVSILAEHITEGGIKMIEFQQSPYNLLWCIREDGDIALLTRDIPQQVTGWSRLETEGKFLSVASIPKGEEDQVWVIVRRVINGAVKKYVEYFMPSTFETLADAFFLDCGLTYNGAAVSSVSGLDHLEGETVDILADGAVHPQKTVSSGAVTLNDSYSKIHVGLSYTSTFKGLKVEAGSAIGTAQGQTKRINKAIARFYRTLGGQMGSPDTQDNILYRAIGDLMDAAPDLFTGDKEMQFPQGYNKEGQVYITQSQPLPMTILGVILKMDTFDA